MDHILALTVAVGSLAATLCGGLFALRFKDKLHLILGFSAGAVLGLAFFDLLPEALELGQHDGYQIRTILTITVISFLVYMIIDRYMLIHSHDEHHSEDCENEHHAASNPKRGDFGAGSFSVHSFLDGLAIGLAFQLSQAVGIVVAVAVLVHDFSDGINTVNLVLKNGGENKRAFYWLIVDAFAPVLGVLTTFLFIMPSQVLVLALAAFSGFFLYIGAVDLLPESHHGHNMAFTSFMTIVGVGVLYGAIKLAGI